MSDSVELFITRWQKAGGSERAKRQQAAHPTLTLTGMYNVLEKLKSGAALTDKEKVIYEQGLVSVLKQLHDELDLAVLDAYGWSDLAPLMHIVNGNPQPADELARLKPRPTLAEAKQQLDETLLERLVSLNAERAAEEARGLIRWLRPEFQNPSGATAPTQGGLDTSDDAEDVPGAKPAAVKKMPWPKDLTDQVRAVTGVLNASPLALSEADIAAQFSGKGAWRKRLPQLLEMLTALGRAREVNGRYVSGT